MEHRADELSADEEATAEHEFQRLLARYDEPARLAEPAGLANRVMAGIPGYVPAEVARRHRRQRQIRGAMLGSAALLFAALFGFGFYGVLFDSSAPAALFGTTAGGFAQVALMLTLSAKPLVNLLLTSGLPLLPLLLVVLLLGGWFWQRLLRNPGQATLDMG